VTRALLLTIFAMYGVQLVTASESPLVRSIELGANYAPLVFDGQVDRLITANWLHAQGAPLAFLHILMNSIGLLFLGRALEILLGPGRYFIIYVVGCVAGAAVSTWANRGVPSLGASTGIVGLFAAIGYILFRFRRDLPVPMRRAWRQWVFLLLLNVGLWIAFTDVGIDHWGHAGGFTGGAIATVLLTVGWPPFARRKGRERVTDAIAVVLAMVVVAGLAVSLGRFSKTNEGDRSLTRRIFATAPMDAPLTPLLLNDAAWTIAIDPEADPHDLDLALGAAERAVGAYPDDEPRGRRALSDTRATLLFRLGRYGEAVTIERRVFEAALLDGEEEQEQRTAYATQLARFSRAMVEADGPLFVGDPPALTLGYSTPSVTLSTDGDAPEGLVFYALATDDAGTLLGLLRGALAPGADLPARRGLGDALPDGTTLTVAVIDGRPDPAPESGFSLIRVGMNEEVSEYP
jgi:rhomboid protease GluP